MSHDERQRVSSGAPYEPQFGYCRAVRDGDRIFIAGTAPIAPDGTPFAPGDPTAQTQRCLDIIQEALQSLGASLNDVVRTRLYLTRRDDWQAVAQVHGQVFADIRPACTLLVVAGLLDPQWLVEIEAEAVCHSS